MKKSVIYLLAFIFTIATLTGCQLNEEDTNNVETNEEVLAKKEYSPEVGGEIILALTTFDSLNPLITENNSYYFFSKLIFEALFQFGKDLNIENQLAESYEIKDNGKTIDIKLNGDAKWHDGEGLKAEDIKFTVNAIKYANTKSAYKEMFENSVGSYNPSSIRRIIDVVVIDNQNVSIRFDKSFSNNLELLTFPIIPSHIFGPARNASYAKALEVEDYKPIGTGAFKFESYEKMKEITLLANEEFRDGRPYVDKIIGRVFESEEDILQAFETREVNVATTLGVDWEKYTQEDSIRSIDFITSNYEFLGYNFSKGIFSEDGGKNMRKAITYAIDRQAIIEKVYLGHGTQIDVPIHPDSWLLSEKADQYGYNLDMAKAQLGELDLVDENEDGIWELNGKEISLKLLTNTFNPLRLKTAKSIKEDLEKIGIKVEISPEINEEKTNYSKEEIENQWTQVNADILKGNYDILLSGWQLSIIPDLSSLFHSNQIRNGMNFINYSNEDMNIALENTFLNGSRDEKKHAYGKLQDLIIEELPYSSLLFKNKSLLLDSKIMGQIEPSFFSPYKGIEKAYIPKEFQ